MKSFFDIVPRRRARRIILTITQRIATRGPDNSHNNDVAKKTSSRFNPKIKVSAWQWQHRHTATRDTLLNCIQHVSSIRQPNSKTSKHEFTCALDSIILRADRKLRIFHDDALDCYQLQLTGSSTDISASFSFRLPQNYTKSHTIIDWLVTQLHRGHILHLLQFFVLVPVVSIRETNAACVAVPTAHILPQKDYLCACTAVVQSISPQHNVVG